MIAAAAFCGLLTHAGRDEVLNGQKLDVFIDALALAQRINALNTLTQADNNRAAAAAKK
jgi:hypothetical protein